MERPMGSLQTLLAANPWLGGRLRRDRRANLHGFRVERVFASAVSRSTGTTVLCMPVDPPNIDTHFIRWDSHQLWSCRGVVCACVYLRPCRLQSMSSASMGCASCEPRSYRDFVRTSRRHLTPQTRMQKMRRLLEDATCI